MCIKHAIVKTVWLGIILGFIPALSQAATLSSTVDRNRISLNETVVLTINYDKQVDGEEIDLAVLNSEFEVLRSNPQSSNAVSIVNGKAKRQASTTWSVLLAAKATGTLTIPSFSIGQDRSQPISIEVSDGSQANTSDQPLQVWVSVDQETVYPSQQFIVEVEISAQANVADLNGPQLIVNDADVEALGQQNFQRVDNGVARQIVILRYAVFPKQVGELVIPVMTYTGIIGGRRSIFGSSGSQVVARSSQVTIKVEEPPKSKTTPFDSAPWFPAQSVTIESTWSGDKNAITVGEPITRTITIRARGQLANIIPPLQRPSQPNAYKSYKDQAQLDTKVDSDGFIGVRVESEAIVASTAGELVLPALDISWWNIEKGQWQSAKLPAETLQVLAGAAPETRLPISTDSDMNLDLLAGQSVPDNSTLSAANESSLRIWQVFTILLALVCAVQSWLLFRWNKSRGQFSAKDAEIPNFQDEREAWQSLQSALNNREVALVRKTLVTWARSALNSEHAVSLRTLVSHADDTEFALEIEKLEAELYKTSLKNNADFNFKTLIELLKPLRQKLRDGSSRQSIKNSLPPLYPE